MGSETGSASPKLLVVDDDKIMRTVVVRGLRDAGFSEIHEAEDGLAAQEYLSGHTVDVVITDVMMPRLGGLELIRWAKQHDPQIVWIIFSSMDQLLPTNSGRSTATTIHRVQFGMLKTREFLSSRQWSESRAAAGWRSTSSAT